MLHNIFFPVGAVCEPVPCVAPPTVSFPLDKFAVVHTLRLSQVFLCGEVYSSLARFWQIALAMEFEIGLALDTVRLLLAAGE